MSKPSLQNGQWDEWAFAAVRYFLDHADIDAIDRLILEETLNWPIGARIDTRRDASVFLSLLPNLLKQTLPSAELRAEIEEEFIRNGETKVILRETDKGTYAAVGRMRNGGVKIEWHPPLITVSAG